jgi:hypothetical protein
MRAEWKKPSLAFFRFDRPQETPRVSWGDDRRIVRRCLHPRFAHHSPRRA